MSGTTQLDERTRSEIVEVLKVVAWMDNARWQRHGVDDFLRCLNDLKDDDSILLAHWLCYVSDRMKRTNQVWTDGATVLGGIVGRYRGRGVSTQRDVIDIISPRLGVRSESTTDKSVPAFVFEQAQGQDEKPREYTVRYPSDWFSIARTLIVLLEYDKSLTEFLRENEDLWRSGDEDMLGRIAFLLYTLTYKDSTPNKKKAKTKAASLDRWEPLLLEQVEHTRSNLANLTENFDTEYENWNKTSRYHKRLWAALRDYLRVPALSRHFVETLGLNKDQLLPQLELPGDVWNDRFSDALLKTLLADLEVDRRSVFIKKASPVARRLYRLVKENGMDLAFHPEQLDVSFDFAPRMCEMELCHVCPFGPEGAKAICFEGKLGEGKLCPVLLVSCGYVVDCNDYRCPVFEGTACGICRAGLTWTQHERGDHTVTEV